jgi:hypothetical protein
MKDVMRNLFQNLCIYFEWAAAFFVLMKAISPAGFIGKEGKFTESF